MHSLSCHARGRQHAVLPACRAPPLPPPPGLAETFPPPALSSPSCQVLAELPQLRNVSFKGCPLAALPNYRERVAALMPRLEILDNQRVAERPRKQAALAAAAAAAAAAQGSDEGVGQAAPSAAGKLGKVARPGEQHHQLRQQRGEQQQQQEQEDEQEGDAEAGCAEGGQPRRSAAPGGKGRDRLEQPRPKQQAQGRSERDEGRRPKQQQQASLEPPDPAQPRQQRRSADREERPRQQQTAAAAAHGQDLEPAPRKRKAQPRAAEVKGAERDAPRKQRRQQQAEGGVGENAGRRKQPEVPEQQRPGSEAEQGAEEQAHKKKRKRRSSKFKGEPRQLPEGGEAGGTAGGTTAAEAKRPGQGQAVGAKPPKAAKQQGKEQQAAKQQQLQPKPARPAPAAGSDSDDDAADATELLRKPAKQKRDPKQTGGLGRRAGPQWAAGCRAPRPLPSVLEVWQRCMDGRREHHLAGPYSVQPAASPQHTPTALQACSR